MPSFQPDIDRTGHETLTVDTAAYLGSVPVRRIKDQLTLSLNEHCFPPRPDDLQADWVASIAAPAFRLVRERRGPQACGAFCSIGTGSGLDALVAAEILGAALIGVTDVHEDLIGLASDNITRNLRPDHAVTLLAGSGDLLEPLRRFHPLFDIIYENLPNVPLDGDRNGDVRRNSSNFVPPRREAIPLHIRENLLALHYIALLQAKDFLASGGSLLSLLGGRVPLASMLGMAEAAGYRASFLSYAWKVQAEAADNLAGYAAWERQGLGPFHFYRIDDLERVFAGLDPVAAAARALAVEAELAPFSIDATAALAEYRHGARIGHTAVVLQSDRG